MAEVILAHFAEAEEGDLKDIAYEDIFTEDNPDDFETIFDNIVDRMREEGDVDYEAAYDEANAVYFERTGIDRTANQ